MNTTSSFGKSKRRKVGYSKWRCDENLISGVPSTSRLANVRVAVADS